METIMDAVVEDMETSTAAETDMEITMDANVDMVTATIDEMVMEVIVDTVEEKYTLMVDMAITIVTTIALHHPAALLPALRLPAAAAAHHQVTTAMDMEVMPLPSRHKC